MITGIDTHFYLAKDFQRALAFYRDALGMAVETEFASGSGVEFILSDGSTFCLAQMPGGEWHRGGGAMFAVPDVAAASKIVKEAGGQLLTDVFESPVCFTQWCEDPEGNSFALHKRK